MPAKKAPMKKAAPARKVSGKGDSFSNEGKKALKKFAENRRASTYATKNRLKKERSDYRQMEPVPNSYNNRDYVGSNAMDMRRRAENLKNVAGVKKANAKWASKKNRGAIKKSAKRS
jgi:hypothetical protein